MQLCDFGLARTLADISKESVQQVLLPHCIIASEYQILRFTFPKNSNQSMEIGFLK